MTADVSSPHFTPSTFEFQGCRFALQRAGTGPPVVFIQGVGVHGRGWTPQIEALASRFACLCFDNRGMGESQPAARAITVSQMAKDALGLITHLGWASAHLVGHSLGGPIALEMTLRSRRASAASRSCAPSRVGVMPPA